MSTVWMVCGNKGGVGKSVASKAVVDWLVEKDYRVAIADGDLAADVAMAFDGQLNGARMDLATAEGWAELTDWLCANQDLGQVVVNLPDAVTERTLTHLERYRPSVDAFGYRTVSLFMMNTLPDGLSLLPRLVRTVHDVYPVKNLFFGASGDFIAYDKKYGRHFPDKTIYFPAANARVMNQIREDGKSYRSVLSPNGGARCCTTYARLVLVEWLDSVSRAFDESLLEHLDE